VNAVADDGRDAPAIDADTALECGICWHVYDPAVGDEVAQIPPGTPFTALPADWCCPNCDAPQGKFLVLGTAIPDTSQDAAVSRLVGAYRRIALAMHGLPIYNPQVVVEAVGFRESGGRQVGVIVTPWFMNLTLLPTAQEAASWRPGQSVRLAFPSGEYDFLVSELEEVGLVGSCSLFSPMNDFAGHEAARLAAEAAATGLFSVDEEDAAAAQPPRAPAAPAAVSRRALLGATP
jgi:[NiFe] hydrogenase assembly HybE family chaperone